VPINHKEKGSQDRSLLPCLFHSLTYSLFNSLFPS
jgi:hypothetical protein